MRKSKFQGKVCLLALDMLNLIFSTAIEKAAGHDIRPSEDMCVCARAHIEELSAWRWNLKT